MYSKLYDGFLGPRLLWVTCTQVFHPPLSLRSFYPSVYQLRTTQLLSLVVSTLCHQLLSLSQCPLFSSKVSLFPFLLSIAILS